MSINEDEYPEIELPEELVSSILTNVESLADEFANTVEALERYQGTIRRIITQSQQYILRHITEENINQPRIYGVDGTYNIFDTVSRQLVVVVAVAVGPDRILHRTVSFSTPPSTNVSLIARAIMTFFEINLALNVANNADLVISDGSLVNILTTINAFYGRFQKEANDFIWDSVEPFFREMQSGPWFSRLLNAENIIYSSKRATAKTLVQTLLTGAIPIRLSDVGILSIVLHENEYVYYLWKHKEITGEEPNLSTPSHPYIIPDRDEVIDQYNKGFYVIYFKPRSWSRAYKLDVPRNAFENHNYLLNLFKSQVYDRAIKEPYPQFIADVICKNAHIGILGLKDAIDTNLFNRFADVENIRALLSYYRTTLQE